MSQDKDLDLIHRVAYNCARAAAGGDDALFIVMRDHAFSVLNGTPVRDINRLCNMIAASLAADKMTVANQ